MPEKAQYLVVTASCSYESTSIMEIIRLASLHQTQILHCHVHQQGELYLSSFLLGGSWSNIAKLESALLNLPKKETLHVYIQRTHKAAIERPIAFPYMIYLTTMDDPEVLHEVTSFLQASNVNIQEIFSEAYLARHTKVPMLLLNIRIQIPATSNLSEWREQFMIFCDAHNFDAVMEPEK